MKTFITTLQAIDKADGLLKTFAGKSIIANDENEAKVICNTFFPYLSVLGEHVAEIDEATGIEINIQAN